MARTPLPARTPLIGRERVLDALWGEVTASAAEGGRVAVVRGPAGIGKTRLLEEFAQRARSLGAVVVAGRSSAVGGYAYGALADALAAYVRSSAPAAASIRRAGGPLAQLVPALVAGDGGEDVAEPSMLGVVQSAYRLVAQVTERRPMVLVLDDVHAADAETCEVLHSLRRHAHDRPWTLVLGLRQPGDERSAPGRRLVDTLRRDGGCLDVELEPLDQPATAALATAVLGEGLPAPSLVEMLHRRTAGNPYYVEEMVRWFHAAGHLSREGLQWAPRPGCEDGVPPSIEEALSERIATLPAADRTVLEWICAAGGRAELSLLGDVGGLDAATLGASLEQLCHAHLVVEEGGRAPEYRVRHPLVSECVYREMSLARRRLAHRALAFALSDRGSPAGVVATHFSRCAQVGDGDAIAAAMQAAADAESALHLARAVSWYQLALSLLPGSDNTLRPHALDRLSELASQTGHLDVGLAATQELLAHTPGDALSRRLVMLRRLAGLRGGGGHVESTRAAVEEALALAEHGDPSVARLLVELMMTACTALPVPDIVDITRRGAEVADRAGARPTALMLTSMRAHAIAYGGDPRTGADLSYATGAESMELQDGMAMGCSVFARGVANTLLGRFGEAADALGVLADASEQAGLQWESTSTWTVRSEAVAQLGRFDEAVADSLRAEDFGRRHGGQGMLELAVVMGAQALVLRGDLVAARERLDEARRMLDRRQTTFEGWYWYARAMLAEASGEDPRSVVDACRRMWEWATLHGYLWLVSARPMQVHALLAIGDVEAALALAEEIAAFLATHDIPRARPLASVALGAALVARGEVVEGVTTAVRGVEECDAIDGALIAATARLRAGEALVAAGERRRGVELLGEAQIALAGMGARPLRDRARAALRAAGVALGDPGSGARATTAPSMDGAGGDPLMLLSPRERDVAMLAVSGSSSRSIGLRLGISERTVENHLANAYAKLRVHSRAELIALLSGGTPAFAPGS